jgi:hypothetical protein
MVLSAWTFRSPQAKEWLEQQEPGLKQRITERLEKINPFGKRRLCAKLPARRPGSISLKSRHLPRDVGLMARHEGRARREKSPAVPPLALGRPNRPEKAAKAPPSWLQQHNFGKGMTPLQPVSIKFTDDERAKLKALATALGWTESQVVRDSVAAIVYLVQHPDGDFIPKIIGMARQAMQYEENPPCFSST